ncbi:hypothetical protein GPECTOR_13g767 [Gonium pectorale]|uniref:Uncharacterized protein n=1 Tax=Gonium pectorale TaxID=33097 RepID=A0A150GPL6_GONPE|nr:hypothetical protein GPECTOR_13g767 [Gonium pectorale]|eukprot:KXZ51280.1 hypothetical protein GPECTOR_13g767 [Gonium pectorale]
MSGPPPIHIVLWNDGGSALASGVENEDHAAVLHSFADLVTETISSVLELPKFRHVAAKQAEDAAEASTSPLSIAFDASGADGEVDLAHLQGGLDVSGLLLGTAKLPEELAQVAELVVTDEEQGATELQFKDESLVKELSEVTKRTKLESRYNAWFASVEEHLGEALDAASAQVEATETPMDPFDLLQAIVAQIITVAGVSPLPPNLLQRGGRLLGGVLGAPRGVLRQAGKRLGRAQRLWWRLEDVVVDGSKLALRLAVKAARPVIIVIVIIRWHGAAGRGQAENVFVEAALLGGQDGAGFVLHRVLKTLDESRSLGARVARLSPEEAQEEYVRSLLGADWQSQLQADLDKACADVNDGLVTDEINQEKRLMTAAQLRRLEIEEWDKQRMKNFYLASYGGLRWFDNMEQALHNPLFIESRGWTDPVENWVGRNRTYARDLPQDQLMADVGLAALRLKEAELGRRLSAAERAAVLARGSAVAGDLLPVSPKDPAAVALAAGGALVPSKAT